MPLFACEDAVVQGSTLIPLLLPVFFQIPQSFHEKINVTVLIF